MNLENLKTEIDTDPVALGYAGKTDAGIADLLNAEDTGRTIPVVQVDTDDVLARIDEDELATLYGANADSKQRALNLALARPTVNPSSSVIQKILVEVFGATSDTIKNLTGNAGGAFPGDDLRVQVGSRAQELFGEPVTPSQVARAKALP